LQLVSTNKGDKKNGMNQKHLAHVPVYSQNLSL